MLERHDQKLAFLCFRAVFVSYCPLFWGSMDIYKEYDSLYILERNDKKNSSFLCLWPFSWTIAHSFGIPGWFTRSMILSTCLSGMTKNSSFLRFRAVFVRYCPQFWGSGVIQGPWHLVHVWVTWPKSRRFCVYGCFRELLPTILGFWDDLQGPWHLVHH
jgi:hypothetical protein